GFLDLTILPQPKGRRFPPCLSERVGLSLAACLGERRGEVREDHGKEKPDVQGDEVGDRGLASEAGELCEHEEGDQGGPDLDHEHHRVLPLDVGPEHHEGLLERGSQKMSFEESVATACLAACLQLLGGGAMQLNLNFGLSHGLSAKGKGPEVL